MPFVRLEVCNEAVSGKKKNRLERRRKRHFLTWALGAALSRDLEIHKAAKLETSFHLQHSTSQRTDTERTTYNVQINPLTNTLAYLSLYLRSDLLLVAAT